MAKRPSRSKSSDDAAPAKPTKPRASRAKVPAPVTAPAIAVADDAPSAVAADTDATQAVPPVPTPEAIDDPAGNNAAATESMSSEPSEADLELRAYQQSLHRGGGVTPTPPPPDDPAGSSASATGSMSSEPSEQEIRLRAYHKFLHREGGPGTEFEDWIEAEQELGHKSGGDKRQSS